jgi:hypothetical protein
MSSIQLWQSPDGRVIAEWNKVSPTWRVYWCETADATGPQWMSSHASKRLAIRAAKRRARMLHDRSSVR